MANRDRSLSGCAGFLRREGGNLIRNSVWHIEHTQNFLMKFRDAESEQRPLMLPVLKANLNDWVNNVFITKDDFVRTLTAIRPERDPDFEQQFLDFMSEPKTTLTLNKLGLFESYRGMSGCRCFKNNDGQTVDLDFINTQIKPR